MLTLASGENICTFKILLCFCLEVKQRNIYSVGLIMSCKPLSLSTEARSLGVSCVESSRVTTLYYIDP
jgi:hypothetical protein